MSATTKPIRWIVVPVAVLVLAALAVVTAIWITSSEDPTSGGPTRVTVIGDSYTAGTTEDTGAGARWPALVEQAIDVRFQLLAAGGSGYTRVGTYKPELGTYVSRTAAVGPDAEIIVFFGSVNDRSASPAELSAASLQAFGDARRRNPAARLVVVGPLSVQAVARSQVVAVADTLRASAERSGAQWVDPVAEGWLQEPGDIGADGIHPTDQGHRRLAEHFEEILRPDLASG